MSWRERNGALETSFHFEDFATAFAFLTRVALHAEKVNHHPEFTCNWNKVDFRLTTHDANGITKQDHALAAEIERLALQ